MSGYVYDPSAAGVDALEVALSLAPLAAEWRYLRERAIADAEAAAPAMLAARRSEVSRMRASMLNRLRSARLVGILDDGEPTPRGCFHEGCDEADGEEGGTHWCRWAP